MTRFIVDKQPLRVSLSTIVRAVPQRLRANETVSPATLKLRYAADRKEASRG